MTEQEKNRLTFRRHDGELQLFDWDSGEWDLVPFGEHEVEADLAVKALDAAIVTGKDKTFYRRTRTHNVTTDDHPRDGLCAYVMRTTTEIPYRAC
jgi:hypothetical protein